MAAVTAATAGPPAAGNSAKHALPLPLRPRRQPEVPAQAVQENRQGRILAEGRQLELIEQELLGRSAARFDPGPKAGLGRRRRGQALGTGGEPGVRPGGRDAEARLEEQDPAAPQAALGLGRGAAPAVRPGPASPRGPEPGTADSRRRSRRRARPGLRPPAGRRPGAAAGAARRPRCCCLRPVPRSWGCACAEQTGGPERPRRPRERRRRRAAPDCRRPSAPPDRRRRARRRPRPRARPPARRPSAAGRRPTAGRGSRPDGGR